MKITTYLLRQSRYHVLVLAVALVALVGVAEYWLGHLLAIAPLYVVPVAIAATALGRPGGVMAALAGVLSSFIVAIMRSGGGRLGALEYIDGGLELLAFVFITLLLGSVKDAFAVEWTQARTDGLTGMGNRTFFLEQASRKLGEARRNRQPLTAAAVLFDELAEFSELAGGKAAEEFLRVVGESMSHIARSEDVVGRLGDNLFMIVCPNIGAKAARAIIERLERHLEGGISRSQSSVLFCIGAVTFVDLPRDVDALRAAVEDLARGAVSREQNVCTHRTIGDQGRA